MRILSLETSTRDASVAVADGDRVLRQAAIPAQPGTASGLQPAIADLLEYVGWTPAEVEWVAVNRGPGSFTGLRVAVAAAKAWCFCTGAGLVAVNTFQTLAQHTPRCGDRLACLVDAQRGEWMVQWMRAAGDAWQEEGEAALTPAEEFLAGLESGDRLCGPPLLRRREPPPAEWLAPAECWKPTAAAVAEAARRRILAGVRDDWMTLLPWYSRPSAAEEKGGSANARREAGR